MNIDEIIRMARDAGIRIASPMDTLDPRNVYSHELERFAALVASAEREACAKVCDDLVLDYPGRADLTANQCAAAIRARSKE